MSGYAQADWFGDKILVGKLIEKGEYEKAREHLHTIFLVTDHLPNVQHAASGALFMLELLKPRKK